MESFNLVWKCSKGLLLGKKYVPRHIRIFLKHFTLELLKHNQGPTIHCQVQASFLKGNPQIQYVMHVSYPQYSLLIDKSPYDQDHWCTDMNLKTYTVSAYFFDSASLWIW